MAVRGDDDAVAPVGLEPSLGSAPRRSSSRTASHGPSPGTATVDASTSRKPKPTSDQALKTEIGEIQPDDDAVYVIMLLPATDAPPVNTKLSAWVRTSSAGTPLFLVSPP
jgi:hypothetical protein